MFPRRGSEKEHLCKYGKSKEESKGLNTKAYPKGTQPCCKNQIEGTTGPQSYSLYDLKVSVHRFRELGMGTYKEIGSWSLPGREEI